MQEWNETERNERIDLLRRALAARAPLMEERHQSACRLFNGFTEGWPALAVDLYGQTIVLHDYDESPLEGARAAAIAGGFYQEALPWIRAILWKARHGKTPEARRGVWLMEGPVDRKVRENRVWYALDLQASGDAGLYLDTRVLREWLRERMAGQRVLNTFAHTGSLGVAARAGGAGRVVHLDLRREWLNLAKTSYTLNGFPIDRGDFIAGDFWMVTSRLIRAGELYDCIILDPPFFAVSPKGRVDIEKNFGRLINKVRPLVADGGCLIAINNGVFVSGAQYLRELEELCSDGYMEVEACLPVGGDFTGEGGLDDGVPLITDPAPFNHSTKIAVLRIRRKDGARERVEVVRPVLPANDPDAPPAPAEEQVSE
jgi:23S rRNA (cytosine1962-C5)-methyltransferase